MKKYILFLALAFVVLFNASFVLASLECNYNDQPNIKLHDKITWLCNTTQEYCLSYVSYNNQIIQVNPLPETIGAFGVIDYFEVSNNLVNVEFRNEDLRHNKTVIFGVKCGNETLEHNVTPLYQEPYKIIDRGIWIKENIPYFIGVFLLVCLIIAIIIYILQWR